MNNITLIPLTGSEKQIRWAERIRKKVLAFVLENKEAIAEQISKDIAALLERMLARCERIEESKREKHIAHAHNTVAMYTEKHTVEYILNRISNTSSSKTWIEKFRNGVKTVEEAAKLVDKAAFSVPYTEREYKGYNSTRDFYNRMEAAKERMRDGFCC